MVYDKKVLGDQLKKSKDKDSYYVTYSFVDVGVKNFVNLKLTG